MTPDKIMWVTPQKLKTAAKRLYRLLKGQDKAAMGLLDVYDETFDDMEFSLEALNRDLKDIGKIADYVDGFGIDKMTMTYAP